MRLFLGEDAGALGAGVFRTKARVSALTVGFRV